MKVLVVGGVAAGTKVAAKLKRELGTEGEITVITKGDYISYAACGLPYYIGGVIKERETILEHTPESYSGITGVNLMTGIEALKLDRAGKKVLAKNVKTGEELEYDYDKLVITTGARPVLPPIPGIELEGVYTLRDPDDADKIKAAAESGNVLAMYYCGNILENGADGVKPDTKKAREWYKKAATAGYDPAAVALSRMK